MLYKLKNFCEENDLSYETIKKRLQKNTLNGVKMGKVWAIDEETKEALLREKNEQIVEDLKAS